MEIDLKLKTHLEQEGYTHLKMGDRFKPMGLCRFVFTTGLVYGIDKTGYTGRFCYESHAEALEALNKWEKTNYPPSGNWIKHKGDIEFPNLKIGDTVVLKSTMKKDVISNLLYDGVILAPIVVLENTHTDMIWADEVYKI